MDARIFYYMIQKYTPNKIILYDNCIDALLLAVNTKKTFKLNTEIIYINSEENDIVKSLVYDKDITYIPKPLQDVDATIFKSLSRNDMLFIDSSHAGKLNSDVLFYLINILPYLNQGVLVQIHDIFLPNDYPTEWIKMGRFWNEQYFLYSFLQGNKNVKIKFSNSYAHNNYKDLLDSIQNGCYEQNAGHVHTFGGGSIWLEIV
jgi:hypothetical protein